MVEKIAVFIDSENTNPNCFADIYLKIIANGDILIRNIYGDWSESSSKSWKEITSQYGLLKIQCDKISGKNSVDIKMCVDIMKYLYTNDLVTMFYLVTCDCDFRHLIHELKQQDKIVHCVGTGNTNINLTSICDNHSVKNIQNIKNTLLVRNEIDKIWMCIESYLKQRGNINGCHLKTELEEKINGFDHINYNCKTFTMFLKMYFRDNLIIGNGYVKLNL